MEDHSRSVSLYCPTCGCGQFEHDPDEENAPILCAGCDRVFTREQLIRENGPLIEDEVEDFKKGIVEDFRKQMREAFRGNKHIKFK
jgi:uncharacterized Zn finger protein (UPF0148 family)